MICWADEHEHSSSRINECQASERRQMKIEIELEAHRLIGERSREVDGLVGEARATTIAEKRELNKFQRPAPASSG